MLAEWFYKNAEPEDKLSTTMYPVVKLFIPEHSQNILHTGSGRATTFNEFINECYKRNITYVAWDSRIGFSPKDSYYKLWNIQKIAPLSKPRDVGPFEFIKKIDLGFEREQTYVVPLKSGKQYEVLKNSLLSNPPMIFVRESAN